jgi:methylated-DNA-[protein]-cysteine S-methyltransferase
MVYRKLLEVPEGRVTTYSELGRAVGLRNGQRAIGTIMAKNPFPGVVPCHRVVKSDGRVGGYAYGTEVKEKMLSREGVRVSNGRIADFEDAVYRF